MNYPNILACMLAEQSSSPKKPKVINYDSDTVTIYAELQDCKELNRNGRKYPYAVVKAGLLAENIQELLRVNSLMGEADHPVNPTLQRQQSVLTEHASHRILRIDFDDENEKIYGLIKTMPNANGRLMRDLILDKEYPLKTAYSLRAVGNVKRTPQGDIVVGPIRVMTYDWVKYPSHRNAYQTKIVESALSEVATFTELADICVPITESADIDIINKTPGYKLLGLKLSTMLMENKIGNNVNDLIDNDIMNYMAR